MSFSFKKSAQVVTSACPLHAGREQLKTNDVTENILTLDEFSIAHITDNGKEKTFGVITFVEKPGFFYNCGQSLTNVINVWIAGAISELGIDTDLMDEYEIIEAANNFFCESGEEVKFRMVATQTKSGNNFTRVEIL